MSKTVMQVYSGSGVDILAPQPRDFRILDIAMGLSKIARFTGHTYQHASVAQHSVLVSILLEGTGYELEGLMHDAHEAFIGDISSPMKAAIREEVYRLTGERADPIKTISESIDRALAKQFGLIYPRPPEVKAADMEALTLERKQMMLPPSGVAWTTDVKTRNFALVWMQPEAAAEAFMIRYKDLVNRRQESVQ